MGLDVGGAEVDVLDYWDHLCDAVQIKRQFLFLEKLVILADQHQSYTHTQISKSSQIVKL
jgi:hypothetical protein